jgi:hypothetical protein
MAQVLSSDPGLANTAGTGFAPAAGRPETAFERKARAEGRTARDVVFRRVR